MHGLEIVPHYIERTMIDIEKTCDSEKWNKLVDRSDSATVYHRFEFLEITAKECNCTVHCLIGKKGNNPVALFPVFSKSVGPVKFVFSPPPGTGIRYLGPIFILDPNIKFRKSTKTKNEFIKSSIMWIDDKIGPHYSRFLLNPYFSDTRAYTWNGYSENQFYTHQLNLERSEEELLKSFSRDARKSITSEYDTEYYIEESGIDGIKFIISRLRDRYETQGMKYNLSMEYICKLYENLSPEYMKVYIMYIDGEPISGRISLRSKNKLIFWQGAPKPKSKVDIPINDLLNWHSLCSAKSHGCTTADLSGANTKRLWKSKAKYNPQLVGYSEVNQSNIFTSIGSKIYEWYNR